MIVLLSFHYRENRHITNILSYAPGKQILSDRADSSKTPLFSIQVLIFYTGLWFNWWVSFAPEFQCCYFCESSCLFDLSFNFDFCVSKIMHL